MEAEDKFVNADCTTERNIKNMRELLETFFRHYLGERNLEATLELVTENVISLGTGEQEVAKNKEELRKLMTCEFSVMPDPLEFTLQNYMETQLTPDVFSVFTNVLAKLNTEKDHVELYTRLTCICCREKEVWKIASLHMSTPSDIQEEHEFFPLRYGRTVEAKMSVDSNAKLMELVAESIPGGIMGGYLEEGYPLYTIDDKMLNILGYTYEELVAATGEKMLEFIYKEDRQWVEDSIAKQFAEKGSYEIDYRAVGKDNRILWVNDIGRKIITDDGREAMISIITDITERVEREKQLTREAHRDSLTGLYNRKKAISMIEEAFGEGSTGILFICDVDNFKSINDTRGHAEGDKVLIELAKQLKEYTRGMAIAARLGGDEYMLYCPDASLKAPVIEKMKQVQSEFMSRMQEHYPDLHISISVGGTVRKKGEDFKTLYSRADEALYLAKHRKGEMKIS